MNKKYYVVIKGKKSGIFSTWEETKKSVIGYKGAVYKSFLSEEEAKQYFDKFNFINDEISQNTNIENELVKNSENNIYSFFVDGSYNKFTKKIGFGVVCYFNGIFHKHSSEIGKEYYSKFSNSLNVVGEIFGSLYVLDFCKKNSIKNAIIFFDYEGIEKWATGAWSTKSDIAIFYKKEFDNKSSNINISFQKVKAHSDIEYNNLADELAKKACQ